MGSISKFRVVTSSIPVDSFCPMRLIADPFGCMLSACTLYLNNPSNAPINIILEILQRIFSFIQFRTIKYCIL